MTIDDKEKNIATQDQPTPETEGANPADDAQLQNEMEAFDSLIDSYMGNISQHEIDSLVSVSVVKINPEDVLVDMGDKAEGVIPIQEFLGPKDELRVSEGDKIDVVVLGRDEETGLIEVSHRLARVQAGWERLEEAKGQNLPLAGHITRAVKSGVLVDVGIECFMPASHISDRRVNDLEEWVGKDVDVVLLDLDRRKNRAVVSRRKLIEEQKRKALEESLGKINEGDEVTGKVKSVLNFGAFLDIAGLDAFLPREELSWDRALAPQSALQPGQETQVKILQVDRETGRVRVSRKALTPDPWDQAPSKYPKDSLVKGEVVAVTRYGAFVRLEEGLTGLIHVSDLSWSKGQQRVTDYVKEGDTVQAAVLGIDTQERRMSLGLKQLMEDPWEEAEKLFPKGSKIKGIVSNLATFGAFVKLNDDIEGMIHISDLSWETNIKHPGELLKAGEEVEAVVLKSDRNTRRISLGLKQLKESPNERYVREHPVGTKVEGEVVRMIPSGAFINLAPRLDGFMHVSQMDQERVEKPEDKFKKGDKVNCQIVKVEKGRGAPKISLSLKAMQIAEERKAIKQFRADPKDKGVMKLGELLKGIELDKPADE